MLVSDALGALEHVQHQIEQAKRKAELITMGRWPRDPARAMPSLPSRHGRQPAAHPDRQDTVARPPSHVQPDPSGGEDEEHVIEVVTAHVTAWQRDHKRRWRLPSPAPGHQGDRGHQGRRETVRQIPEVQQLATTVSRPCATASPA
jgi:hypothetical protein